MDDWEFFDSLIAFFQKYYDATIENRTDGISTRSYQLRARNEYFMVEHNEDFGNWFYSCDNPVKSSFMDVLASDLENRLASVPYV